MYWRYGKINFMDILLPTVLIFVILWAGIWALFLNIYIYGVIFVIFSMIALICLLFPYGERYCVNKNMIVTKKFFHNRQITIPSNSIVIITVATLRSPMSHQSYFLRNQYGISIISDMPLCVALDQLHGKDGTLCRYTNSTIEQTFGQRFIYSFTIKRQQTEQLLDGINCQIIVPESLKCVTPIINRTTSIYIDRGY